MTDKTVKTGRTSVSSKAPTRSRTRSRKAPAKAVETAPETLRISAPLEKGDRVNVRDGYRVEPGAVGIGEPGFLKPSGVRASDLGADLIRYVKRAESEGVPFPTFAEIEDYFAFRNRGKEGYPSEGTSLAPRSAEYRSPVLETAKSYLRRYIGWLVRNGNLRLDTGIPKAEPKK